MYTNECHFYLCLPLILRIEFRVLHTMGEVCPPGSPTSRPAVSIFKLALTSTVVVAFAGMQQQNYPSFFSLFCNASYERSILTMYLSNSG